MPRENKTRYALLGMLTYSPMSGYDMKKMSDHSIGHFWNENYGNIYPVLKKMEAQGLVTMERQEQDDAPDRKEYSITDSGRQVLADWMGRLPEPTRLREELLLQVFFGQWFGPDATIDKMNSEILRCESKIAELKEIRRHMEMGEEGREDVPAEKRKVFTEGTPFWKSTVIYGLNYYRAVRKSCRQIIEELETAKGSGKGK